MPDISKEFYMSLLDDASFIKDHIINLKNEYNELIRRVKKYINESDDHSFDDKLKQIEEKTF